MVRFGVAAVVLVAACYSPTPPAGAPCPDGVCPTGLVCSQATMTCEHENAHADAARNDDAADGPPMVTGDARQCFGSGLGTFCLAALPTGPLSILSDTTIDTDSSTLCVAYSGTGAGSYCIIAGTNITIGSHLVAVGTKPLIVIGTNSVSITATLDVASHRVGPVRGAGGNSSACVAGDAAGAGQGGAGGSFGGAGGIGGNGEQGGTKPNPGTTATPTTLRGGCRGRNGSLGAGGNGGGAVYVIAGTGITITGAINASGGAGARSATNEEGGGGGGSGGMIALEAPTISGSGQIFANGAGGGPGNDNSSN